MPGGVGGGRPRGPLLSRLGIQYLLLEGPVELFNTSTPEKAFKTSVRPLGGLFILQSLCLLFVFSTWPADSLAKAPLPFVPDPAKKYFLIASAILILIIGIGLFIRFRPLWYAFIAYLIIGPCWVILGIAFDYFPQARPKTIIIPTVTLFSALISGGLYLVTKPAFKNAS